MPALHLQRRPGLGDPADGQQDAGEPAGEQAPAEHDGAVPGMVPGEAGRRVDAGVRRRRAVLRHGAGRVARGALLAAGAVAGALQGIPRRPAAAGIVRVMMEGSSWQPLERTEESIFLLVYVCNHAAS